MTEPLSRALKYAREIAEPYGYYNCDFSAAEKRSTEIIQSALNEARAEALEEAAKKAEAQKHPEGFLHYTVIRAMKE